MFKKYNSIENTYRNEFLDRIKGHGFWEDEFVVQEKAHGANLSFWTTDGEVFFARKRTDQLPEDEKFFNYEIVLEGIKTQLKNIWNDLKLEYTDLNQFTVFGEIIGGDYPHPEVEANKKAILVQKGIYYSPKNHFYAFDILLNGETYLSVDTVNRYFEKHGLLHVKSIFRGSISDCLDYPNDFDSNIATALGLPVLTPNVVEGVVIKPVETQYFNNGSRVILKNKNEKWAENKKYHGRISTVDEPTEQVLKLKEAILGYVTENRLNNVVSKIGEVTQKDSGKLLGMFSKDVVEDFLKDYHEITDQLEKKELKSVTKSFGPPAMDLVKECFKTFV